MSETCRNCRFWLGITSTGVNMGPHWDGEYSYGKCRISAPTRSSDRFGRFPETDHDDWCGQYEAQPTAALTSPAPSATHPG